MKHHHEISTREKFNHLKKYYDETWDSTNHTLHVGMFNKKTDSLNKAYMQATDYLIKKIQLISPITSQSRVLDVGCGTGRTIIDICDMFGCEGTGLDISDEQIKDAKSYLQKINRERLFEGKPKIKVKFIRGSGSDLVSLLPKNELYTHVISQDAILLISNKQSLFQCVERLLVPGGLFTVTDFLSESDPENVSRDEKKLVYELVNWNDPLSQKQYEEILKTVGLHVHTAERHDKHMIQTYQLLANKMTPFAKSQDTTYTDLKQRYESIVASVRNKKMGWGFFFAQKPARKTVLIAGTNEKSIGRFLGKQLQANGWDVWLYGRHARRFDAQKWHERPCDISQEKSIKALLKEIHNLDLVLMLADSGGAHGSLEKQTESVKDFVHAKLVGSVLLPKAIAAKFSRKNTPINIIWCAGKPQKKEKSLIVYGMVNAGLASYIEELNRHYSKQFNAYYLSTGLISPSTLGDAFITDTGEHVRAFAKGPETVWHNVQKILKKQVKPGMVSSDNLIL